VPRWKRIGGLSARLENTSRSFERASSEGVAPVLMGISILTYRPADNIYLLSWSVCHAAAIGHAANKYALRGFSLFVIKEWRC
jgi:hypothetical protein